MKNKLLVMATALMLSVGVFTGCAVNVANMGTVNGKAIEKSVFEYYLGNAINVVANENEIQTKEDFNAFTKDGKTAKDLAVEEAYNAIARDEVIKILATENKVVLTEEEKANQASYMEMMITQLGGKAQLETMLKSMGLTYDFYMDMQNTMFLQSKLQDTIYGEGGTMPIDDAKIKEIYERDYIRAKHILFSTIDAETYQALSEEDIAIAKKKADETSGKIKKGTAFEDLADLSEDPGSKSYPDGYVFAEGEMDQAFYEGAKALKVGEVSSIIEGSYGYHIIKRLDLNEKPEMYEEAKQKIFAKLAEEEMNKYLDENLSKAELKINNTEAKKIEFNKLMG